MDQPIPQTLVDLTAVQRACLRFYQVADAFAFSRRQRAVLRTIRRRSFDRGFPQCWIDTLSRFVEDNQAGDCWLDKADASRAIDELVAMRVIAAPGRKADRIVRGKKVAGARMAGWYGINVLFSAWLAPDKPSAAVQDNGWLDLQEPDLNEALRRNFIEFGGESPPTTPQGTRAVESLRSGHPDPGLVRDRHSTPESDEVVWPLAQDNAGRRGENEAPSGARPAKQDGSAKKSGAVQTEAGQSQSAAARFAAPGAVQDDGNCQATAARFAGEKSPDADQVLGKSQQETRCWENPNDPTSDADQSVGKIPMTAEKPANNGPPVGVGKIPMGQKTGAKTAAEKVFSPTPPLSKALNVERSTLNAQKRKPGKPITRAEEAYVMDELHAWLGAAEMGVNGPGWRVRWVRNCPEVIMEEIGWGRMLEKTCDPNKPRNRAAWLMARLKLHFGVREVNDMPVGPTPV